MIVAEIIKLLKELVGKLGYFPTLLKMREMGSVNLENAITSSGLGIQYFQKALGFKPKQKPKGYWKNQENIFNEIKKLITDDKFPNLQMIRTNLGSAIVFAIYENFTGINDLAQKMGYEPPSFIQSTDGHFLNSANEFLLDEFMFYNNVPHEVNGLINKEKCNYRYDFKVDDYYFEIWGYEKRENNKICQFYNKKREIKEQIYKELGYKLISIEAFVFKQNFNEIENYFKNLFISLGIKLEKNEKGKPLSEVINYCYRWNEDLIIKKAKEIMEKEGYLPSQIKLKEMGEGGFVDAIKRFGGYSKLKILLGIDPVQSWDKEKIINEVKTLGFDLTTKKLKELGRGDLDRAISRHLGYRKLREILGYQQIRKEFAWTDEGIIDDLKDICMELRRLPSCVEIEKRNPALLSAIEKRKNGLTYFSNKITLDFAELRPGDIFIIGNTIYHKIKEILIDDKLFVAVTVKGKVVDICDIDINATIRFPKICHNCIKNLELNI